MSHLCRYSLLLSLILISLAGFSQTSKIDSLKKVLVSLPPEGRSFAGDTTRVMVLCELGRGKDKNGLFVDNYKECIQWLDKAELLAEKIKWNKGLLLSNLYAGTWHGWKGNDLKALKKKQQAAYYAEIENNPSYLGRIYRYLGDTYYSLKTYQKAIEYYKKALNPSKIGHYGSYLISMENLGNIYLELNDLKNSKYWLETAYRLSKSQKRYQTHKYITLNLAEVYLAIKDSLQVRNILDEYIKIPFQDKAWDVHYYVVSAKYYLSEGNAKKALLELNKGMSDIIIASNIHQQELYQQLSVTYERLGNSDKALYYSKKYASLHEIDQAEFQKKQIEYLQYEYQNHKQKDEIALLNQNINQEKTIRKILWGGIVFVIIVAGLLIWNNQVLNRKNHQINKQSEELTILKDQLADSNQQLLVFNTDLEKKVKERTAELSQANEKLILKNQEIQEAFVTGKTQERQRVASELHDNLGSTISGLIWQLEGTMPENLSPSEKNIYESLVQQMRNAYSEVRHISHHLQPTELEKGLVSALQRVITDLNRNGKLNFLLFSEYTDNILSKSQELEVYSICLEIITNTLKHSQASQCMIEIKYSKATLYILAKDNGIGFDVHNLGKRGHGFANIEKRVKALGGTITINSELGKGTSFQLTVSFS